MVFSQFANSKLKAGDVLEVGTPEGSLRSLEMQIAKKLRRLCIWKRNHSRSFYSKVGFEKRT
jgi:hypothetical protein